MGLKDKNIKKSRKIDAHAHTGLSIERLKLYSEYTKKLSITAALFSNTLSGTFTDSFDRLDLEPTFSAIGQFLKLKNKIGIPYKFLMRIPDYIFNPLIPSKERKSFFGIIRKTLKEENCIGVKYYGEAPIITKIPADILQQSRCVLIHPTDSGKLLGRLLKLRQKYSQINWVIAHIYETPSYQNFLEKGFYGDLSGLDCWERKQTNILHEIIANEQYSKQVMWGTDFPIACDRVESMDRYPLDSIEEYELPLLEEIMKSKFADDILFKNAERIYGFTQLTEN